MNFPGAVGSVRGSHELIVLPCQSPFKDVGFPDENPGEMNKDDAI